MRIPLLATIKPVFTKTSKTPKYSDTGKIAVIIIKFEQCVQMSLKDADRMANRVDTDQIAPSLIWVWTVCLDLSVRKLRNITEHPNRLCLVIGNIHCHLT